MKLSLPLQVDTSERIRMSRRIMQENNITYPYQDKDDNLFNKKAFEALTAKEQSVLSMELSRYADRWVYDLSSYFTFHLLLAELDPVRSPWSAVQSTLWDYHDRICTSQEEIYPEYLMSQKWTYLQDCYSHEHENLLTITLALFDHYRDGRQGDMTQLANCFQRIVDDYGYRDSMYYVDNILSYRLFDGIENDIYRVVNNKQGLEVFMQQLLLSKDTDFYPLFLPMLKHAFSNGNRSAAFRLIHMLAQGHTLENEEYIEKYRDFIVSTLKDITIDMLDNDCLVHECIMALRACGDSFFYPVMLDNDIIDPSQYTNIADIMRNWSDDNTPQIRNLFNLWGISKPKNQEEQWWLDNYHSNNSLTY